MSLLAPHQKVEEEEEGVKWQSKAGIVTWSPPQPNWNPWVGCNIDEGPMAHVRRRYLKIYHRFLMGLYLHFVLVSNIMMCSVFNILNYFIKKRNLII